jgi:hypothetical protein
MSGKDTSMRQDILSRIDAMHDYMTEKHNKVFSVRFNVRFPASYPSSGEDVEKKISTFSRRFKEYYDNRDIDITYLWAREQASSPHPHYHFSVLADGGKVQSTYGLHQQAERAWKNALKTDQDGLIDHCNHSRDGRPSLNGTMIRRVSSKASGDELKGQQEEFEKNMRYSKDMAAYLAKSYSKDKSPPKAHDFGGSMIPQKDKQE